MINQLVLAGSHYFSPGSVATDQTNSVELISTDKPTQAEMILERLMAGEMSVQHVPADVYLDLLQTLREKMAAEIGE